jgi:hypothetical protein
MAKGHAKRQALRLRKSTIGDDLITAQTKAAADARTGGDLRVAADDELFVIDTAPTPKETPVRTTRASKRAAARVRAPIFGGDALLRRGPAACSTPWNPTQTESSMGIFAHVWREATEQRGRGGVV